MKKAALTLGLIFKYVGSCGTILFVIFSVVYLLFGVSNKITGAVVFLVLSCPFALLFLLGRKLTSGSDKTPQEPPMSAESIEPQQKEDFKNNTDKDIKISSSVIREQEERTKKLREEQTLKYAQKITFENNNKEFVELMSKYISQTIE